jgi:hypothetical protein
MKDIFFLFEFFIYENKINNHNFYFIRWGRPFALAEG